MQTSPSPQRQLGAHGLHAVDSRENGHGQIALQTAMHAARQPEDTEVRVHAKSAALERGLELQLSLAGVDDRGVVGDVVADDDQIRDALIAESRGDMAGALRLPYG